MIGGASSIGSHTVSKFLSPARDTFALPVPPRVSTQQSWGIVGSATPTNLAVAGSPTVLAGTTPGCHRPASRHTPFLRRTPSFNTSACNVRTCTQLNECTVVGRPLGEWLTEHP